MMMHIATKKISIYQVFVADIDGNYSNDVEVMNKLTPTSFLKPNLKKKHCKEYENLKNIQIIDNDTKT